MEFPILNEYDQDKTRVLHLFFQHEFIRFFYLSSRHELAEMESRLFDVLSLLKKKCAEGRKEEWIPYIKQYYQLMAFTRDSTFGKGEHDLCYRMIRVWYLLFPSLALYFLHQIVKYGSWRDLPHLCHHLYCSGGYKGENMSIIEYVVDMMNRQLEKDCRAFHAGEYELISSLAKWIPREHKQMNWLNSLCVKRWMQEFHGYILYSAVEPLSLFKAINKGKRMYRKKISLLNHFLDTTEIKQCSRQESFIVPERVSKYTLMRQPGLVFGDGVVRPQKQHCRDQFRSYYETHLFRQSGRSKKKGILLPVSHYVKEAYLLLDAEVLDVYRARVLNKQWILYLRLIFDASYLRSSIAVLPLLDVSFFMQMADNEGFYAAVGLAILAAQNSSLGRRIMVVDQFPTWIDFSASTSFIETISILRTSIQGSQQTFADFPTAMDQIALSMYRSGGHLDKIVIFSRFSFSFEEGSLYDQWMTRFDTRRPDIVFWHLSNGDLCKLPCSIYQKGCMLMSGYSANVLKELFVPSVYRFPYLDIQSLVCCYPELVKYIDDISLVL
jgi:hypothetical protein